MGLHTQEANNARFLTVVGGKLREKVDEGTEGAVKRSGEVAGNPFEKWELIYPGITGFITKVELQDGKYGKNVLVHITDENDNKYIVSLSAENSASGVPFLSALPNLDLTKEVSIKPYTDYTNKFGKHIKAGLSITQDGKAVKDAFYDYETKESLRGMPKAEPNKRGEVNWKLYFAQRDEWLQNYLLEEGFMSVGEAYTPETTEATTEEEF